jgi:RimJ/RimL family protein N-acetyltransferase
VNHVTDTTLRGRNFHLRPPVPADYGALYLMATTPPALYTGRLNGQMISFEDFRRIMWQSVVSQFVIAPNDESGQVAGIITLDNIKPTRAVAYLSVMVAPKFSGRSSALAEAMALFLHHCFHNFELRKIYVETTDASFSGLERHVMKYDSFTEEGRLLDDALICGERYDTRVFAIWRDRFIKEFDGQVPDLAIGGTFRDDVVVALPNFERFVDSLKQEFPEKADLVDRTVPSIALTDCGWDSLDIIEVLVWMEETYLQNEVTGPISVETLEQLYDLVLQAHRALQPLQR